MTQSESEANQMHVAKVTSDSPTGLSLIWAESRCHGSGVATQAPRLWCRVWCFLNLPVLRSVSSCRQTPRSLSWRVPVQSVWGSGYKMCMFSTCRKEVWKTLKSRADRREHLITTLGVISFSTWLCLKLIQILRDKQDSRFRTTWMAFLVPYRPTVIFIPISAFPK